MTVRLGLVLVRISIILVSLIISVIIALSVLPLTTGDLTVDLPDNDLQGKMVSNGVFNASFPVKVHNGGTFGITDLTIRLKFSDGDLKVFDKTYGPFDAPAGETTEMKIDIGIPLSDFNDAEVERLVFESSTLQAYVEVHATYPIGLASIGINTTRAMDWGPLVSDLSFNTTNVKAVANGTSVNIILPYHFLSSTMVNGQNVQIKGTISNGTSTLASTAQNIVLSTSNDGDVLFTIGPQTAKGLVGHPQDVYITIELDYSGASFQTTETYHWTGGIT